MIRSYSILAIWLALAAGLGGCAAQPGASAPSGASPSVSGGGTGPAAASFGATAGPAAGSAAASGTFVGHKADEFQGQLDRLQANVVERAQSLREIRGSAGQGAAAYFASVGQINARLQAGTTPGNPILVRQWNDARGQLDRINGDIARLTNLSNEIAGDARLAGFLLESVRATYGLSGALDEDHRALAAVEDGTGRTVVAIDRLLNEVSDEQARQQAYLSAEQRNLAALSVGIKNGELLGQSLANRAVAGALPSAPPQSAALGLAPAASADPAGRRPLVVIRFDRPNVAFEQPLYTAVSQALERRPGVRFDLVAVTPSRAVSAQGAFGGASAKRNAEAVLRALNGMGLPADRVALSAQTSAAAFTPEVHLYVR